MIIYYHNDHYLLAEDSNQKQYFFTSKADADKSRRQLARQYFVGTDRDYYLKQHPVKSFELISKSMIVHCLNEAAAEGFVSCIEHAEEI